MMHAPTNRFLITSLTYVEPTHLIVDGFKHMWERGGQKVANRHICSIIVFLNESSYEYQWPLYRQFTNDFGVLLRSPQNYPTPFIMFNLILKLPGKKSTWSNNWISLGASSKCLLCSLSLNWPPVQLLEEEMQPENSKPTKMKSSFWLTTAIDDYHPHHSCHLVNRMWKS